MLGENLNELPSLFSFPKAHDPPPLLLADFDKFFQRSIEDWGVWAQVLNHFDSGGLVANHCK